MVVDAEKMGKSGLDVAEGYGEVAVGDGVFVECGPGIEGDVAIMGGSRSCYQVMSWQLLRASRRKLVSRRVINLLFIVSMCLECSE